MDEILTYCDEPVDPSIFQVPKDSFAAYLADLMALVRTLSGVCDTYKSLSYKLFSMILKGYERIDIVADTYRGQSLKNPERLKRATSSRVMVQSALSKMPRNFKDFLKNGENKSRLIELIQDVLIENKEEILEMLKYQEIMFSMDKVCKRITRTSVSLVEALCSNQEEADTKLLLHAKHMLDSDDRKLVLVRSPSGDVDIQVLYISTFLEESEQKRIYIDFGNGKSRKILHLDSVDMNSDLKSALTGFHTFTGNDYLSCIFRKSKKLCWKALLKSNKFVQMFKELGNEWELKEELISLLEEYICSLFGKNKMKDVNLLHYEICQNVYEKKGKIIDLSLLPPCRESLVLQSERCNYLAKIWRSCLKGDMQHKDISNHGWTVDGEIDWVKESFPDDIQAILVNENRDNDDIYPDLENEESDSENESSADD